MRELPEAIPDVDVLAALEPEQLAAKMIFFMRGRPPAMERTFALDQLLREMIEPGEGQPCYPSSRFGDALRSVSEAWAWATAQGLLVPAWSVRDRHTLSRRAERFADEREFADYATARLLQRDMLHPAIAAAAWQSFMRSDYPTAVFQAMRQVEIAVREAAGFPQGDHGVPMIRRAFGKTGPLSDPGAEEAEREALCSLFAGAVGSYKNPHSHRQIPIESAREAAEIVMLASHLVRVIDERVALKGAGDVS